jgi:hypothetical protein
MVDKLETFLPKIDILLKIVDLENKINVSVGKKDLPSFYKRDNEEEGTCKKVLDGEKEQR